MCDRENCQMRNTDNGNCSCMGGFCLAVKDEICEALQSAYDAGRFDASKEFAKASQNLLSSKDSTAPRCRAPHAGA